MARRKPAIQYIKDKAMQDARVLTYKPKSFQNQRLFLGTVVTAIIWYILAAQFHLSGLLGLVLAVQIILFLLVFYRPVWAMAALIVGAV